MRKVFATFLLFVFIVLFFPFTLLLGAYSAFFEADFYKGNFSDLAYDLVIEDFPGKIVQSPDAPPISEGELRSILMEVLTPDDFYSLVDEFSQQIGENAADSDGIVDISLSLDWFRDKNDLILDRATELVVKDLSACTENEFDLSLAYPNCVPEEEEFAELDFRNQIRVALDRQLFGDLPNQISFEMKVPMGFDGSIADFFSSTFKTVLLIVGLTLILVIGLIALIIFKPALRVWQWVFMTLTIASFVSLLFVTAIFFLTYDAVLTGDFVLYQELLDFLMKELAKSTLWYLLPFFALSLILWVVFILKKSNESQ